MRETLRQKAAKIRPTLRVVFASLLILSIFPRIASGAETNSAEKREAAKAQLDRAEKARQDVESRPENARTLKEYTSLVLEYKRVYLITPRAMPAPVALNQVAGLYRTMGDLFSEKYYQSAVEAYQFLLREYPTTRYREDALLAIARIEQDDLHDAVRAQKSYEQFLALHPRSSHAAEVTAILEAMKAPDAGGASAGKTAKTKARAETATTAKEAAAEKTPAAMDAKRDAKRDARNESSSDAPPANGTRAQVSNIRTWNADKYTRIVIDVGAPVKYQAARISNPDRIYFDIEGAKMSSALLHNPVDLTEGGYLKDVRVAQNQSGVVRVVLEVNHAEDYSVFLLPNPYRLVVDVYGTTSAAEQAARAASPPPGPTTDIPPVKTEKPTRETLSKPSQRASEKIVAQSAGIVPKDKPAAPKETSETGSSAVERPSDEANVPAKKSARIADTAPAKSSARAAPETAPATERQSEKSETLSAEASAPASLEAAAPEAGPSSVKKSRASTKKSAHDQAREMGPPATPELTRDGQHSLTRALGLKIGRIVIDAGHGGHDTGTIGPTGLMEKDLCLDVALRVGKLIRQRLPSAEVVFTRDDDTFVPLEQRTEIANDARADLFLSIHANSSQDRHARGIETYYLNFTGSSDAMEVASRENALSENGVHDLQDIVQKIAKNEKIEESRDFAGIIQDSLAKRMEGINRGDRNRGVRKAPFVVLIGANMPSVLAEISFISNPSDEQWLKKPENRQKVADGLYRGIENYLQSTNSLANNQPQPAPGSRSGIVARSGNSQ
jgi:N-acetylmuramoyl-L-alanine amidase